MSVSVKELNNEQEKLKETRNWIETQISGIEKDKKTLEEKLLQLQKERKGNKAEFEINNKLYNNLIKNFNKYKEASIHPYFSKISFREKNKEEESIYIGKFSLYDSKTEEEKVVDWRSPIADLYYSGTEGKVSYEAPIGEIEGELLLKRKFLFKNENLVDAFDEGINQIILNFEKNHNEENGLIDEFLRINLEKNVGNKLKDVVATIQKEQNDIIRANLEKPIIVQGSAGSGKTTVAMHRLAYLLYRYKNKIKGEDIIVIAPNKLFLDYISEILPSLGVDEVKQTTFEEFSLEFLNLNNKIYTKDEKLSDILKCNDKKNIIMNVSKLKGSLVFKIIIDRYVKYLENSDCFIEDLKVRKYVLFKKTFIRKLYIKDLKHLSLNKRKEEINRYFNGRVKEKTRDIKDNIDEEYSNKINEIKRCDLSEKEKRNRIVELYDLRDEEKETVEKEIKVAIKIFFDQWQNYNLLELYYKFIEDKDIFNLVTSNIIPEVLQSYMVEEIAKNKKNNIIDSDDLAALMYLKIKLYGTNKKFKHTVIDEAQDYSFLQMEVIKEFTLNNSMTIVGDIGQGIYYYKGIKNWEKVITDIFKNEVSYVPLTQSYRSTIEIIEVANKVLEKQDNNLKSAKPVLRHGMTPEFIKFLKDEDFCSKVDSIVDKLNSLGKNNICIIGKDINECNHIINILNKFSKNKWNIIYDENSLDRCNKIIPSYMTKGLEFDCSIIYNCNSKNYSNTELHKKLLYVVLTRALHFEYIFYKDHVCEFFN
ncbi:HelD family protein [Clostridium massiliodielmoense]|uniref:HelD family protein n=1 Tax=Clostridium massiliodielmoense TaxID=1776385 RepID=UPI0004D841D3|nr:UvrD-helicase domain-containing protein [Clostridium massiliodielmoense]KEH97845.1 ATPase AAA [Clostridium botulinum C/D str. BKT12695]